MSEVKSVISIDDFAKCDIRVGTVLECGKVEKSEKLLKFLIDLGSEKRQILSGIAKHYCTEELIGRQVIVLVNLPPRKMMGLESNGMILTAFNAEKNEFKLLTPMALIDSGSEIC